MQDDKSAPSVVVGIDGSETAIQAAHWAVAEAVELNVPLRLVYVTKATHSSSDDYELDVHKGKSSLQLAQNAIEATGRPVKVETAIVTGPPSVALIAESQNAGLICVGTVGIDRYARSILGSTATELAAKAHCPVAVIRPHDDGESSGDISWIAVAVNNDPGNDVVVAHALREARLRGAPVLAVRGGRNTGSTEDLDARVAQWRQHYPDVHIYPIAEHSDLTSFLRHCDERLQLVVIGGSQADELAQIVGPAGRSILHHAKVSVLVVRN
ncbi:universal stress protein [Mycolicibacterium hippocampi]|uniref:Universal stress protein family n=1 Tax=Mycolicibacterium hippocampi TaxID=659824 RepID=A0A850PIZ1_9MYCO|nr:universal stress protein [Mycolicibacterium hippocampi]NVN48334.1 Universal stress protein family [Mycolicibacterium hippocampi]